MKIWEKYSMPEPKTEASKGKFSLAWNEIYSGLTLVTPKFWIRLDGWKFHRFSHLLKKPFDKFFAECLCKVACQLMQIFNSNFGYIFSDEINLFFSKPTAFKRIEKIDSVFAGLASSKFYQEIIKKYKAREFQRIAFDCRCIVIETKEQATKYLIWRQAEAFRNFNNAWSLYLLGKKEKIDYINATKKLKGKKTRELRKLINKLYGLNKIPKWQERGIGIYWEWVKKKGWNPIEKKKVEVKRRKLKIDWNLPIFAKTKNFLVEKLFK